MAGSSKDTAKYSDESPFPDDSPVNHTDFCTDAPGDDYLQYSKDTSDYTAEEPEIDERVQELTDKIRTKLIMNKEKERLTEYFEGRLAGCGWKVDIRNILRTEIQKGNGKDLTLEQLYELVRERAKMLVPMHLRKEMMAKIQESYHVDIPVEEEEDDDSEDDSDSK